MKRVGRWTRKENQIRLVEIWNSVGQNQARKGYATVTDIANDLNMTRSTHLKNLIFKLVLSDAIDVRIHRRADGIKIFRFYFSDDKLMRLRDACKVPWHCDGKESPYAHSVCIKTTHGTNEYCPVLLKKYSEQNEEDAHNQTTIELLAAAGTHIY